MNYRNTRNIFKTIIFILSVIFLSSCAFHAGNTSSNAAVMNGDFSIMDIASGEASTVLVFGIGGLSKDALVLEAKKDMYRNFPLQEGQIYANITVDYKRGFYIFVVETTVTVSADIIQFNPSEEQKKNDVFSNLEKKTAVEKNQALFPKGHKPINEEVGVFVGGEIIIFIFIFFSGKKSYEL